MDGAQVEFFNYNVMRAHNGRIVEMDYYSEDQLDLATARYNEPSAAFRTAPALENLPTASSNRTRAKS